MKNKQKIILLVIASRSKLYDQYLEYWKHIILKKPSNVDIYILLNDEKINQPYKIDKSANRIYFKYKESYIPGILLKTIEALKLLSNYDFVIRTNLSTFFNFNKLINFLQNNRNDRRVFGPMIRHSPKFGNTKFIVGFCIIMNNNIVKELLKYINYNLEHNTFFKKIYYNWADDVVIGYIFNKLNIPMINISNHLVMPHGIRHTPMANYRNKFIFRNRILIKQDKRIIMELPKFRLLLKQFKIL